ncbi:hypothetical protein [Burkholderia sp. AU45388]|uniref:hypothetical protein n=1 Tax=Burkholderia sp. AU45388 TaxID=3059206 RepID=UPI002655F6F2|nr:hypothetical protein [Burkholderia sp. AU45388]MDN7427023.1 hypothetical protein [Burkholderia sp. AU45388]
MGRTTAHLPPHSRILAIRPTNTTAAAPSHIGQRPAAVVAPRARAGFTHYPSEWWHGPFGDRYWAILQNESHAIYSPVDESMLEEASR